MPKVAQVRSLSLVLVGDFNPPIFQPMWFVSEGLLTQEEAQNIPAPVIHPDVATFVLPWLQLTVEREKLQANCLAQPYFERVVGLICKTFELLRHTPVKMVGINNEAHYRASSMEAWHALGHRLAPKDEWRRYFPAPGMQNLTIRQAPRTDDQRGYVQVTVQPSIRIHPGIFIAINDHFETDPQKGLGATQAVEILQAKWAASGAFAEGIFAHLAEQV